MQGCTLFVWCFIFVFGMLLGVTVQQEIKTKETGDDVTKGNCIVRDGRDGLPGLPGSHGPPGRPGRDGRDCFTSMSHTRVFDLEKRFGELNVKCQLVELEARKMMENVGVYRYQTQKLLKILAAKGIIDSDNLKEALVLADQLDDKDLADTTSTEVPRAQSSGDIITEAPTLSTATEAQRIELKTEAGWSTVLKTRPSGEKTEREKETRRAGEFYTVTRNIQTSTSKVGTKFPTIPVDAVPRTEVATSAKKESKNGEDCQKRFQVNQVVETNGAVNMDVFQIDNTTYLAVANFHLFNSKHGYSTKSFVYRMNPDSGLFEIYQKIPTFGCRALVSFVTGGDHYLVAANHYNGVTHLLPSVIYKWTGTRFQRFRQVNTFGASSAQFFTIAEESYLIFANYRNKTTVSVSSVIYKWKEGNLEVFQEIQTHGAVDCEFYQTQNGDAFLVFANYYTPEKKFQVESTVLKWNGHRFVHLQSISTSAAISVEMFEYSGTFFLVLASHRTTNSWHSHCVVFQWNGTAFEEFQDIPTTAAVKIHHFYDANGSLYLTIANYFDEITDFETHSMVYKFQNNNFVKFQGILTTGAYDLRPFTYKGVPYLASAFRFDGKNSTLQSRIYKLSKSCSYTDDGLLP